MERERSRWTQRLQRALSFMAAVVTLTIVGAGLCAYLVLSGPHVPTIRSLAGSLGRVFAGQKTEHMALDLRLYPHEGRLAGRSTLTVRSEQDGRRLFYFLLDGGLRVQNVRVRSGDGAQASVYPLALLTVVDVGRGVSAGDTVELAFEYAGMPGRGALQLGDAVLDATRAFLNVDSFWYPSDLQGFFTTDVAVTLPADMTVVHNSPQAEIVQRGALQTVRWRSNRPLGGLALLAGRYSLSTLTKDGSTLRAYVADGLDLDPDRILRNAASAHHILTERLGPSGFDHVTLCVDPRFGRAFNDGSGVLGISTRHLRGGDYGFGLIAHEVAHNWWGGTVAEKWLSPGTGGQWIVEGFAEFSSLIATEAEYGPAALRHRLAAEFFDPRRDRIVSAQSAIDNALDEQARETIYRKGAYVAFMLRDVLGEETYFSALREFLARFRHSQVRVEELRNVLEETTQRDLTAYFADWVDSARSLDLTLDALNERMLTVHNLGEASVPGQLALWSVPDTADGPAQVEVSVNERLSLAPGTEYAELDPQLRWADVERANNRHPRQTDPLFVAARGGDLVVTSGEPYPWMRTAVTYADRAGTQKQVWDFAFGMPSAPQWSADGRAIVVSHDDGEDKLPDVVLLSPEDGARRLLGRASDPAIGPDGTVYAAQEDRIVRFAVDAKESALAQRPAKRLRQPRPAPDGRHLAYVAEDQDGAELRLLDLEGGSERVLGVWNRDRLRYAWEPDGSGLYVVAPGTWDWELWEISVGSTEPRRVVDSAVSIADLALAPNGARLAFTAAPELEEPPVRHRLYVMDLTSQDVQEIDLPETDLGAITWEDPNTLVAVAAPAGPKEHALRRRSLKRIRLPGGAVEDVAF